MTVRYQVRHISRYRYDRTITQSFNEARVTPAATRWQNPLESTLRVDQATWNYRYLDYWGTQVRAFEANANHRELVVDASSLVEIDSTQRPASDAEGSWGRLRTPAVESTLAEYLAGSAQTEPPAELAALAEQIATTHGPTEAARRVCGEIHEAMTYLPGATEVHTLAAEAWQARSGVCQDYAHLAIGALRHIGLPARYVSGYLHSDPETPLGEASVGESHAWVEWWQGSWVGYDPTNMIEIGDRHILVGVGRAYPDVPPIKGTVAGTPVTTDLQVTVETTQLA